MGRSAERVPDRISWAIELLDVSSADQVLEIGCGPGVAMALVCDRLSGGRITGIDRSATAIGRSRTRLADHVADDRAALHQVDLANFDGEADQFDRAFAVNVNVFWTSGAESECATLANVLRPGGELRLVYAGPEPGKGRDVGPGIAAKLEQHGFATELIRNPTAPMVCVAGRLGARS